MEKSNLSTEYQRITAMFVEYYQEDLWKLTIVKRQHQPTKSSHLCIYLSSSTRLF